MPSNNMKTVIVTGASSGIGLAIARTFLDHGYNVVGNARNAARLQQAAVQLKRPERFLGVAGDIGEPTTARQLVDAAVQRFGQVDVLVNNAGTIRRSDAAVMSHEDWDAVLTLNLDATFFLTQAVAGPMLARGRGKIINIASMLSFQGGIRVAAYTASKSAIAGITRGLANEWAGRGLNVNAIAPGYVATRNTQALREDEGRSREILARIPQGRWATPQDMGGAAVFLASAASDYVNGAILPVDGGWLAR